MKRYFRHFVKRFYIQTGLDFIDIVNINHWNRAFYESNWMIIEKTYTQLDSEYLISHNEDCHISWETFMALKPFYIRTPIASHIKICYCKKDLYTRWSINALIDSAKMQSIDFGNITSYETFDYLTSSCDIESATYISWNCTPNKNEICEDITKNWDTLKQSLSEQSNDSITTNCMHFEKVELTKKAEKIVKHLKAISIPVNISYLLRYIPERLTKIIDHRNQPRHYRSCIKIFKERFDVASLDIDFYENLSIPVKFNVSHCTGVIHKSLSILVFSKTVERKVTIHAFLMIESMTKAL